MAVPRNRMSNARKNSRQSHNAKKAKCLVRCPNCSYVKPRHESCTMCGFYGHNMFGAPKN